MKKLSLIIGLTLVAMLIFTTTPIQAKDNPSKNPLCDGLTGKAKGICTAAVAKGCDKVKNQSLKACKIHEDQYYDVTGEQPPWVKMLVKTEADNNNDGTKDSASYHTYDANGNLATITEDNDYNGTIDRVRYYTYDTEGRRSVTRYDDGANGSIDLVEYYLYDADGNLKVEVDVGDDGTIDRAAYYTYDANGNTIQYARDYDYDGIKEYIVSLTNYYDINGNLIRVESDEGSDGAIDSASNYTYDANGRLTTIEVDDDNNGTIDQTTYFTYDAYGYRMTSEADTDGDGDIDRITYYTYE